MSVTSGFFNSINGDKKYNADDINEYYKGILDDGVVKHYDADLEVEAGSGMTVNVMGGKAICLGKYIRNIGVLELAIEPSESQPRYDAVVVGVDLENRSADIYVKKGIAAVNPSYPAIINTDLNKELCLAYVYVSANAASVTVTDTRSDATICGYVRLSEVETIPTINYTIGTQENTCDKTYSEIIEILDEKIPEITIKHGASINYVDYAIKISNMGLIISARTNEGKVTIEHSNNDNISVTFTVEHFQEDIDALESNLNKRKQVIYTLDNINATTATCNLAYNEIKDLITNNINYSISVKLGTSYYTAYEVINGGNIGIMVNIPEEDKKVMVSHASNNTITVASGTSDIATITNKVNPLWNMRWIDGGNVTSTDGIFVPWSDGAASTVLILCMNNSDDRCCQVFLARKTMSSAQRAMRLCGASDTLGVYASISQSQGVLVALTDDVTPYPTGAQIYYQYIEL